MNYFERLFQAYKFNLQVSSEKFGGTQQPLSPKANIVIACITSAGLSASGKGSKQFFKPFCQELRRLGFATHFCISMKQVQRCIDRLPGCILINLFGEDHFNISTPQMHRIEEKAALVFNNSETGAILADKQWSCDHFEQNGIPMPPAPESGEAIFSNSRYGTRQSVEVVSNISLADQQRYNRALIDTVQTFEGRSYYTSVRLMCIADQIAQTLVRARPIEQNDPSVTGTDTPLDPALICYLHDELIVKNLTRHRAIASQLNQATGPCFVAHDLLVETGSNNIYVNESGFKFHVPVFRDHLSGISNDLAFMQDFFDIETYSRKAAKVFVSYLESLGPLPLTPAVGTV